MRTARLRRTSGSEGTAIGTATVGGVVRIGFRVLSLFVTLGAFPDRELDASGLERP